MSIKALRTEADYEAALARIDALMDAEPGTPEGEELDVLTDLVEHYEEKHVPMGYPSAPPPALNLGDGTPVIGLTLREVEGGRREPKEPRRINWRRSSRPACDLGDKRPFPSMTYAAVGGSSTQRFLFLSILTSGRRIPLGPSSAARSSTSRTN